MTKSRTVIYIEDKEATKFNVENAPMEAMREKLLSLLPPERQVKIRQEIETLSALDLPSMTDAALAELYDAVASEISRRDKFGRSVT